MTVLRDKTIKEMIEGKQLVPEGNPQNAEFCSYEFTAAVILRGGSGRFEPIDKLGTEIKPAELVWIKASEEIIMPPNMVGLWIQTQTLARKGLLLLNISLIEPGYQGPLSAVLVNFGGNKVTVSPDTKIAKVAFLSLDGDATKSVGKWNSSNYDANLREMAESSPNTFLQLRSFEQKAEEILERMEKKVEESANGVVKDIKGNLEVDLKGSLKDHMIKWGGGAVIGFLAACVAVWLMISSYLPRLSEYAKFDELARSAAMNQQSETITGLNREFQIQAAEIKSLKKQLDDLKIRNNNPQSQGDAIDTTSLQDGDNVVPH